MFAVQLEYYIFPLLKQYTFVDVKGSVNLKQLFKLGIGKQLSNYKLLFIFIIVIIVLPYIKINGKVTLGFSREV